MLTFLRCILEVPLTSKAVFRGLFFPLVRMLERPPYPAVTLSESGLIDQSHFPPACLTCSPLKRLRTGFRGWYGVKDTDVSPLQRCWALLSLSPLSLLVLTREWRARSACSQGGAGGSCQQSRDQPRWTLVK